MLTEGQKTEPEAPHIISFLHTIESEGIKMKEKRGTKPKTIH